MFLFYDYSFLLEGVNSKVEGVVIVKECNVVVIDEFLFLFELYFICDVWCYEWVVVIWVCFE